MPPQDFPVHHRYTGSGVQNLSAWMISEGCGISLSIRSCRHTPQCIVVQCIFTVSHSVDTGSFPSETVINIRCFITHRIYRRGKSSGKVIRILPCSPQGILLLKQISPEIPHIMSVVRRTFLSGIRFPTQTFLQCLLIAVRIPVLDISIGFLKRMEQCKGFFPLIILLFCGTLLTQLFTVCTFQI